MANWQNIIEQHLKDARESRFSTSPQISLGELISQIENAGTMAKDGAKYVCFDFGYMRPNALQSWRGSYAELAIGYSEQGEYDCIKADIFLNELKAAIGATYEGYKGGDFIMSENTPMWVANYGHSGNTGVIGILDNDYNIVILTSYCEY